jgi:hypothetical protein
MAAWELVKFLTRKETVEQIYQAQTSLRGVGMVYAQVNLADQLSQHPQLGAYVLQAPAARSWYLVSGTTDKNGLNDRINKYYEDAVNLAAGSGNAQNALKPVSSGVKTVLAEYGL